MELGTGFSYLGRQVHTKVGDSDFYVDLLFYQIRLHCYVVVELKTEKFKPEFAGKRAGYPCSYEIRKFLGVKVPMLSFQLYFELPYIVECFENFFLIWIAAAQPEPHLIFVKLCNFKVKMTVLKIALKSFHHACGHQASFSVGKMDDSIFSVNFFYIIFVYQKCPMATHKIAVQYAC